MKILALVDRSTFVESLQYFTDRDGSVDLEEVLYTHNAFKAKDFTAYHMEEIKDVAKVVREREGTLLQIMEVVDYE